MAQRKDRRHVPYVCGHAVEQWRERLAPSLTYKQARRALLRFVRTGQEERRPQRWMLRIRRGPSTRFIYNEGNPDAVAIVVGGVVKTCFSRTQFVDGRLAISGRVGAEVRWVEPGSTSEVA